MCDINIVIPEDFDTETPEFIVFNANFKKLIEELDDMTSILLYRVPNDIDHDEEADALNDFMKILREIAAEINPNWFVIGMMFDLECKENPNRIISIDSDLGYDYSEDSIRNYLTLLNDTHKTIDISKIEIQ